MNHAAHHGLWRNTSASHVLTEPRDNSSSAGGASRSRPNPGGRCRQKDPASVIVRDARFLEPFPFPSTSGIPG